MDALPRSRAEAAAQGATRFFSGAPCASGHLAARHTTNSTCVECSKARVQQWRKKHPDRHRAAVKRSAERNLGRVRAQAKRDWAENSDARRASFKMWYEANRERMRELNKAWYERNKDKRNAALAERLAAKASATPPWLTVEHRAQIQQLYREARLATERTGVPHHVDHIFPIRGVNCTGLHVPWNLQVLTASENSRKKNRVPTYRSALAFVEVST